MKRKKGTLKHEADTLEHMVTRRFANPYCDACVRAKMRRFKTKRGAFKQQLKKWGDLVTFDFLTPERVGQLGIETDTNVFAVRDVYSGIRMAYPTSDGSAGEVIRCMKEFMGKRKIRVAFGEYAPQFVSACQQLGTTFDHSLPGRPRNNSLAERNNLYVLDQVTTCLLAAGLPPCYWSFALTSTCHLLNVEIVDGESAWYNMHGDHFGGKSIPLGAYVHFKPSFTRDDTDKFAPRSVRGVFAGYELESGMRWSGKMCPLKR